MVTFVSACDLLFGLWGCEQHERPKEERPPAEVSVVTVTPQDASVAVLARYKAALEAARLNLNRTKPLVAQNALSQKDLDNATSAFESAAAAVEQAKAELEQAKLNLSYCTIASPVNGITSAALQQGGAYVNPQNSLLGTVAVLSPMWVNFSLSENELQDFRNQIAKGLLRAQLDLSAAYP